MASHRRTTRRIISPATAKLMITTVAWTSRVVWLLIVLAGHC